MHTYDAKQKLFLHFYVIEIWDATVNFNFLYLKLKYEKNQFKIDVLNSIDNVNYQKHLHYEKSENYYLSSIQTENSSS